MQANLRRWSGGPVRSGDEQARNALPNARSEQLERCRTASMVTEVSPSLLAGLRRKVLEKLCDSLVQAILILLRVLTRVQSLGCNTSP